MISRLRLAVGVAAALFGAAAFPSPSTAAFSASWSLTLTASAANVAVDSTVTLTATANQNVSNGGYYIDVDDETTNSTVNFCSTGKTCQVPVTWTGAGSHTFVAYVDGDPSFEYPPCCVQATSNTVTVTWGQATTWSLSLASSAVNVAAGSPVTLTASASSSVTGTGDYIDLFDETTGENVASCPTGATCQGTVSEASDGTYSFIAYVDADPVLEYPPCCVQAQSNAVEVTWHAEATAGMTITFQAAGTLPTFPCPAGCPATFNGWGTGGGTAEASIGSDQYSATFATSTASVGGSVTYTEPAAPFCPADGSADGTVTLTGSASGTVTRTSTPAETGVVTAVTFRVDFRYQRVGATTVVTITGGTATVSFSFPDTGADYFISNVAGAGLGVLAISPVDAASACTQSARSLPFTIAGDAALALT